KGLLSENVIPHSTLLRKVTSPRRDRGFPQSKQIPFLLSRIRWLYKKYLRKDGWNGGGPTVLASSPPTDIGGIVERGGSGEQRHCFH
ncbi:unnamed protein product, partial [Dovyalis caffra]